MQKTLQAFSCFLLNVRAQHIPPLHVFHIKYATKNPSGHSIHFQHPAIRQTKCTQRLKGTSVLRTKKRGMHLWGIISFYLH